MGFGPWQGRICVLAGAQAQHPEITAGCGALSLRAVPRNRVTLHSYWCIFFHYLARKREKTRLGNKTTSCEQSRADL